MIGRQILASALIAAGLCALTAGAADAQTYPSKPVKVIVPFAPGGVDVTARVITDRLQAVLGQPFVVENRPGAGGSVGGKMVATAQPDGYTLMFSTPGPSTIGPAVNRNAGYATKDFAAVAIVSSSPLMLVVNPALPVKTVQELVAYAKAHPGEVRFPSPGYGTQPHLLGELLKVTTGADVVHVPYRGSTPSITDLIAGQVQFYFDNVANLLQYVQAGKLRAIALTSETRSADHPELPTVLEGGLKGFVATYWNGMLAPARTPPNIVARLSTVINEGVSSPEIQAKLRNLGSQPKSMSTEEFAAFLVAEAEKWAAIAKAADVKIE